MKTIICTADWHLRTDVPKCRTETESEWFDFQFSLDKIIEKRGRRQDFGNEEDDKEIGGCQSSNNEHDGRPC